MSLVSSWAITRGCGGKLGFSRCYISPMRARRSRSSQGCRRRRGARIGGAQARASAAGAAAFVTYALIGGLVGMVCGKPPWRQDTFWTSALKGIVRRSWSASALYWGGRKLLGGMHVSLPASWARRPIARSPSFPSCSVRWWARSGARFVEVDDGGGTAPAAADKSKPKAASLAWGPGRATPIACSGFFGRVVEGAELAQDLFVARRRRRRPRRRPAPASPGGCSTNRRRMLQHRLGQARGRCRPSSAPGRSAPSTTPFITTITQRAGDDARRARPSAGSAAGP